jgi:hypothetical protein
MIAQTPPKPNKKYWLLGARVWCSWDGDKHPPVLWEFVGTFAGKYFFRLKKPNAQPPVGFSLTQILDLGENGSFRPFLLNNERTEAGLIVTEE